MATGVFVAAVMRPRQVRKPESRIVLERVRDNLIQNGGRDTDVGDDDFAAQQTAGQQQVARLLAKEGDGQNRCNGA